LRTVSGDNFSAEWPVQAFAAHGVAYQRAAKPKSQIYVEVLPAFNRGLISMPHIPRLERELRLLERRTHRSGRDTVDHGANGTDDFANALGGAAWLAQRPREDVVWTGGWGTPLRRIGGDDADDAWRVARANVAAGSSPSVIAAGSDVPSDETVARWARHARYLAEKAAAEKRNRMY
jgi:hypothetical protein